MSFLSWLRNWKRSGTSAAPGRRAPFRPEVEALEDRWVPAFGLAGGYTVGAAYNHLATTDINHDGKLDLITSGQTYDATTGTYVGNVAVLLGRGNGAFKPPQNIPVAHGGSLVVDDFNHDGNLDVVSGNGDGMSVLLGKGDGTFKAPQNAAGTLSHFAAAADLNGDGNLDIVTNSAGANVLLGNGDGTFRAGPTAGLYSIASIGDFNGDGKTDLVINTGASVNLLPGIGDGSFGAAQSLFSPTYSSQILGVTVDDFNKDGHPDLGIVWQSYYGGFTNGYQFEGGVFLGGSSLSGHAYFTGFNPQNLAAVAAADVNGDGTLDLIAASTDGVVDILPGTGNGGLSNEHSYLLATTQSTPISNYVFADFNGDGSADVAVVNGSEVDVHLWGSRKHAW
jgi:hypothetical protein